MLNHIAFAKLVFILLVFTASCGQETDREPAIVSTAKPAIAESLDQLIAPGSTIEKVTGDLAFTAAVAICWDESTLFFTDNNTPPENSRTYRMDPYGTITLIREGNGRTMSIVPTGRGTYYCCERLEQRITEMDRDGNILRTVVSEYNGVPIDSPNDLAVDVSGGFYFSDTHSGENPMQDTSAVYYVRPDGSVIRVIDDIDVPNGLAFSPDGSLLYVTNTRGTDKGQYVFVCDVNPDGTLSNKRIFAEVPLSEQDAANPEGRSGADGCIVDTAGNLYVATLQGLGVQVYNPAGRHLGSISTNGVRNSACRFGGTDMQTLYLVIQDGVYAIHTLVPGLVIPPER
ncbi:SMP-30/gluconolactonase/LRE family protein [Candidatus Latescibacterota bacterium]